MTERLACSHTSHHVLTPTLTPRCRYYLHWDSVVERVRWQMSSVKGWAAQATRRDQLRDMLASADDVEELGTGAGAADSADAATQRSYVARQAGGVRVVCCAGLTCHDAAPSSPRWRRGWFDDVMRCVTNAHGRGRVRVLQPELRLQGELQGELHVQARHRRRLQRMRHRLRLLPPSQDMRVVRQHVLHRVLLAAAPPAP